MSRALVRIGRRQQGDAEARVADPTRRVDARAKREAEIAAAHRAGQSAGIGQRRHAVIGAAGHHLQPLRNEGAVEAVQRGDVGHRAERHEVEQLDQLRFRAVREEATLAQRADGRHRQQEGDADRGEVAVRRAGLAPRPTGWD